MCIHAHKEVHIYIFTYVSFVMLQGGLDYKSGRVISVLTFCKFILHMHKNIRTSINNQHRYKYNTTHYNIHFKLQVCHAHRRPFIHKLGTSKHSST